VLVLLALLTGMGSTANAQTGTGAFNTSCETVAPADPSVLVSPRIHRVQLGQERAMVLVAPGYDTSRGRYPVRWLLHGGLQNYACFLLETDLLSFAASEPADRQAIVVMPDGGFSAGRSRPSR
jgi:hypothetical protein